MESMNGEKLIDWRDFFSPSNEGKGSLRMQVDPLIKKASAIMLRH